jgi:hypothetical protein
MTIPQLIAALKGFAKAQGAAGDENEITEEEFLAVLAEEEQAGRT